MSKIFFDSLLELTSLDNEIKKIAKNQDEKEELWKIIDEIIHHKVLDSILSKLPKESHEEFLGILHTHPHDESLIFGYLASKIDTNIKEILKLELGDLAFELLEETKNTP